MTSTRRQEYVVFHMNGFFFDETSERPCEARNPYQAVLLIANMDAKYARPYAFSFETRIVSDPVPDGEGGVLEVASRTVSTSGKFYLAGMAVIYDDVEDCTAYRVLRGNMRNNDMPVVHFFDGHWKEFKEDDVIVDEQGRTVRSGRDEDLMTYRKAFRERFGR